jgi:hypothetical protein
VLKPAEIQQVAAFVNGLRTGTPPAQ